MPQLFGQRIGQDFNAANYHRAFSEIGRLTSEEPTYMGSQLWVSKPNPGGDHFEELYHTGLLGMAQGTRNLEEKSPRTTYRTAGAIYGQYTRYHIAYEMLKEAVDDELHGLSMMMVGDLAKIMAETEEYVYHAPYVNGRTFASGWEGKPMYRNDLKTIGDDGYVASNILSTVGGASYGTIAEIYRYGEEFVNDENRPVSILPVRIVTGHVQARKLRELFGASSNIERINPNVPNPVNAYDGAAPQILASNRLANPLEMHVFYQGWQDDFKVIDKYRGQTDTYDKKEPSAVVHLRATRTLQYFRSSRRVALVPGL